MSHRIANNVQVAISPEVARFIDVEAAEDHGEASSDYEEADMEGFIVADDVDEDSKEFAHSKQLYRWDDFAWPDEAKVLHKISFDVQHQLCPSGLEATRRPVMHPVLRALPDVKDPDIWRVHVKVGYERDVVFFILQRTLRSTQTVPFRGVLSAFSRDTISGSIYVESFTRKDVCEVLTGIHGVIRSQQNTLRMDLVPLDDRVALLNMGKASTVRRGSWVRVNCRGRYRGDLGLVIKLEEQYASAEVALVPRITLTLKRDRTKRPKPDLFDPQAVAAVYGTDAVARRNQVFIFENDVYKNGLLRRDFTLHKLSDEHVGATHDELDLFRSTHDEWVVEAADNARTVPLRISDKVKFVAGPCQGVIGRLIDIKDELYVTVESDGSELPLQALVCEVVKQFDLGDFVEVVYGEHRGVAGFIVDMDDNSAIIYREKRATYGNILHQLPGDEITVDLRHIDWKSPDLSHANGQGLAKTDVTNDIRSKMFTGDPYKGMEISIHAGDAKMHFGVVHASRSNGGRVVLDAVTTTRTINTALTLDLKSVRERCTGLPLARARWVPKNGLPLWDKSSIDERPKTPSTPLHQPEGPLSPAWDPASQIPGSPRTSSSSDHNSLWSGELPIHSRPGRGEWLLDARLLHKRLDVRIEGTLTTLSHNGRYENQCGYTVLTKNHSDVKVSIPVKIGFTESRIFFPLLHITPLHTTQRPGFVSSSEARPVISVVGERVVIIGADVLGNSELVGNYALVVRCHWPLPPGQTCVQVSSQGRFWGQFAYFNEKSLCRSYTEAVEWMGTMIN